jgi:hypothetical protein
VQGYYFARPLGVEDATVLLRDGGILQPHKVKRQNLADGPHG